MPTHLHGKDTGVLVDGYDLSGYFRSADTTASIDTADKTAFGATSKSYLVGTGHGTLDLGGMWDPSAGASDAVIDAILAAAVSPVVSVLMDTPAIGGSAIIAQADVVTYGISNPIADVSQISAQFQCTADGDTGQLLPLTSSAKQLTTSAAASVSAFPVNGASIDNTGSTTDGGLGAFHVVANSGNGTDYTCKIQHSADDAAWADLITFTAVSAAAIGSGFASVTGTVNRYIRGVIITTGGTTGTVTYAINFARFGHVV